MHGSRRSGQTGRTDTPLFSVLPCRGNGTDGCGTFLEFVEIQSLDPDAGEAEV
jgi:hypothetical protein